MLRLDILGLKSPVLQNQRRFWRIELGILHHNSPYTRSLWKPFPLETVRFNFLQNSWNIPPRFPLYQISVQPSSNSKGYKKKNLDFLRSLLSHFFKQSAANRLAWWQESLCPLLGHRNWATPCVFLWECYERTSITSMKSKSLSVFAIHLSLLSSAEIANKGLQLWRESTLWFDSLPRKEKVVSSDCIPKVLFSTTCLFSPYFSQQNHTEVADPQLPTPKQRGRIVQGHCVSL